MRNPIPPETTHEPQDIDVFAARFAAEHGEFSLHFDATKNYHLPDDAPWSCEVVTGEQFGGFTALGALQFADAWFAQQEVAEASDAVAHAAGWVEEKP